jgi:hypothetical protein
VNSQTKWLRWCRLRPAAAQFPLLKCPEVVPKTPRPKLSNLEERWIGDISVVPGRNEIGCEGLQRTEFIADRIPG